MEALINSTILVFVSEMGDKTQLLALVLTARYRKPWTILAGVLVATLLNHAVAASLGGWLAQQVDPQVLRWGLALLFFGFAVWILIPDKLDEVKSTGRFGAFLTTAILFFLAEMGDKTQLATVALGARYGDATWVTIGSTLGMLGSNALAIFLGDRFLKKIPLLWVRVFASSLFALFGFAVLLWGFGGEA